METLFGLVFVVILIGAENIMNLEYEDRREKHEKFLKDPRNSFEKRQKESEALIRKSPYFKPDEYHYIYVLDPVDGIFKRAYERKSVSKMWMSLVVYGESDIYLTGDVNN